MSGGDRHAARMAFAPTKEERTWAFLEIAIADARRARARWAEGLLCVDEPEELAKLQHEATRLAGVVQRTASNLVTQGIKLPKRLKGA